VLDFIGVISRWF